MQVYSPAQGRSCGDHRNASHSHRGRRVRGAVRDHGRQRPDADHWRRHRAARVCTILPDAAERARQRHGRKLGLRRAGYRRRQCLRHHLRRWTARSYCIRAWHGHQVQGPQCLHRCVHRECEWPWCHLHQTGHRRGVGHERHRIWTNRRAHLRRHQFPNAELSGGRGHQQHHDDRQHSVRRGQRHAERPRGDILAVDRQLRGRSRRLDQIVERDHGCVHDQCQWPRGQVSVPRGWHEPSVRCVRGGHGRHARVLHGHERVPDREHVVWHVLPPAHRQL